MIKDLLSFEGPIDQTFMVKQSTRATSNNGTSYLSIILQDMSGVLDSKMWQISESDVEIARPGSIVRAIGIMGTYKGHPQLKINELYPVDEKDVDLSKFIPTAPMSLPEMKKMLEESIDSIKDDEIRNLVKAIITERYEKYTTYPAAVTVHHAYMGGLLYHSLSVMSLCLSACERYPNVKRDYLVAGALLHDIGKTEELSGARASSYTDEGNLLGHITIGAMIVDKKARELMMDEIKRTILVHLILSHHGELEFGSPKTPMVPEAIVLHHMDDLDAKMACLESYLDSTEENQFTTKIPWMANSSFYKF